MKVYITVFLIFTQTVVFSQVSGFSTKFDLPEDVSETSGLLFINNKIVTHNDSGGEAKLYEVDNTSGLITRTITITNATNVDWEDIAEDDTHIYIGDIGNNNGTRTDLTIYKVLKTDYANNDNITAEIITYSYEDQTDFSSQPNNHNFDAEAMTVYQGNIIIFTKNWVDLMTNAYIIPTTSGNHSADKTSTYNANGLITGASYNQENDSFMLVGYSDTDLTPFLLYVDRNRNSGNDVFNGGAEKTILTSELGAGSQVEAVIHLDNLNYYISREKFSTTFMGFPITVIQRLFEFSYIQSTTWEGDDGVSPTDWSVSENWSNGVPTLSSNIIIPNVSNQPIIGTSTNAFSNNITVNTSSSLTINGGSLTTNENIINNGVMTLNSGSSLLAKGTSSGDITYNVAIADTNWHLVSSPVIGEGYDDSWVASNGIASGTVNTNNRGISTYDNGTPDVSTEHWRYMQAGGSGTFGSGTGYAMLRTGAGDYSFTGTFPDSDVSVAISQNDQNWNLIGNPYPSFIDISAFITANTSSLNSSFQSVYVWNASTSSYNAMTTGYIHPGQGFFVHSNVASGNVSITEAIQSHQTGVTFYRNSNPTITLLLSDGNNTKQTQVNYLDDKTLGLDPRFDIGLFDGTSSDLRIFTHLLDNNENIAFEKQALPTTDYENMIIPVGVKAEVNTELSFSAEVMRLPEDIMVFLEDRLTNTFTRLDETNTSYSVILSEAINGIGRFYLHTSSSALNLSDFTYDSIDIYKINSSILRIKGIQGLSSVTLFNILGKQIFQTSLEAKPIQDITLPKLTKGVYIALLQTESGIVSKKILLE